MSSRQKSRVRRAGVVLTGLAATLAAVAVAAPGASAAEPAAAPPAESHLVGKGGGKLHWPGFENHPVRFEINAHGNPATSRGTFRVTHHLPDGTLFAQFDGEVDCLMTGGNTAVTTGVIKRATVPGLPPNVQLVGKRVGFTVQDNGRADRVGWSWATNGFEESVPRCSGPAPFYKVEQGGYVVRGVDF
ncbi:hypothetical protein [Streptoalloteichus hindustanus]|uniref:Neocarzinostatin family protein n=1 Tax=Streptoalloteichus hindustanus TaxID=2017 RepID=A0A1M5GGF3_STRHI|nr:hypothetical protein [Streptoalloteichus hindustanus]SHG02776.1 hypothetical protein SAMN05444320_106110 [Streptoalloteichus hindustanus]